MSRVELSIEPMTVADLSAVLADHPSFWGDRDLRQLHLTALVQEVRATYRGEGLARALYQAFTGLAQAQGATSAKAITSPANPGSAAFHQRLGFATRQIPGYNGPSQPMIVMTRPLPLSP